MLVAAGLGYRKEEANHNFDNNQRPDVMAPNTVDRKPNRSQMAIDVSVVNTLSAHRQDTQKKEIERREKSKHTKYYDLGRAEDAVSGDIVRRSGEQLQNLDQQNQGRSSSPWPLCPRPGSGLHPLLDAEHGCQVSRTGS